MGKKLLSLVLALSMVLAFSACGEASDTEASDQSSTNVPPISSGNPGGGATEGSVLSSNEERYEEVVVAFTSAFDSLSPDGGIKGTYYAILGSIYEPLFTYTDGDYAPLIGKSYEIVDSLHWTVEIYDYITDSAGNHITADDIVYSYEYFQKNGTIPKFSLLDKVTKIDEYTVEFTWTEEPTAIFALEHIWCGTAIVSQKAHQENTFATNPVATGPYVVTDFVPGSKVVLNARDDYWQDEELRPRISNANVQTIRFDILTETSQQVIALEAGAADYVNSGVASNSIAPFVDGGTLDEQYNVYTSKTNTVLTLSPNCDPVSPCVDENLRLAIFYALSNEALAVGIGDAEPAYSIGNEYYNGYDTAWNTEKNYITVYDPEIAKNYLSKSSYDGETLEILCANQGPMATLCEIIQNLLLDVGIKTHISAYDYATWLATQKDPNNFDLIVMISGGGGAHISLALNRPFTTADWGTNKTIGYVDDAKLSEMLALVKTTAGGTAENVNQFRQYWMDNAYTYPMLNMTQHLVYSTCFAELYFDLDQQVMPGACTYVLN